MKIRLLNCGNKKISAIGVCGEENLQGIKRSGGQVTMFAVRILCNGEVKEVQIYTETQCSGECQFVEELGEPPCKLFGARVPTEGLTRRFNRCCGCMVGDEEYRNEIFSRRKETE